MRIVVVGYYGFRNLGDEAILSSMLRDLRDQLPQASFVATSGEPERTAAQHSVEAVFWRDVPALAEAVRGSDLVILGGGGLFLDYWGYPGETLLTRDHWGIPFFAGAAVLAAFHGKALVLYAVGVEEISEVVAREATRAVFELSWAASVRDRVSAANARQLGIDPGRFEVTADAAWRCFRGKTSLTTGRSGAEAAGESAVPLIGVALRSWQEGADADRLSEEVAAALEELALSMGGRVLFVPLQVLEGEAGYDDRAAAANVAGRFHNSGLSEILEPPRDAEQAVEIFSKCCLLLGMRYHSVLLAAAAGTPVVGLAYAPKVAGLMEQLGVENLCIPVAEANRGRLGAALRSAWESRRELGRKVREASARLATAAARNRRLVSDLVTELQSPPPLTPASQSLVARAALEAVLRAERRTTEVFSLIEERDGLKAARDGLGRDLAELRVWHEGLKNELAVLSDERAEQERRLTELERQRTELERQRTELERQRTELEQQQADRETEHAALTEAHHDLQGVFTRMTSSRSFRVVTAVWQVRRAFGSLRGKLRRAAASLIPWRTGESRRTRLQSWEGFSFERFKEDMAGRFSDVTRRVVPRERIRRVSVIVLADEAPTGLAATLGGLGNQQWKDLEIVVAAARGIPCDRGEIERLAGGKDRVRVHYSQQASVSGLFWDALGQTRGDAVLWLRQGEVARQKAIARMVAALEANARCDAVCAPLRDADDGEPHGRDQGCPDPVREAFLDLATLGPQTRCVPAPILLCRRRFLEMTGRTGALADESGLRDLALRLNELGTVCEVVHGQPIFVAGRGEPGRESLSITDSKIAVLADSRRDLLLGRILWRFDGGGGPEERTLCSALQRLASKEGDLVTSVSEEQPPGERPRLWLPAVAVRVGPEQASRSGGEAGRENSGLTIVEARSPARRPAGEDAWDLSVEVRRGHGPAGADDEVVWLTSDETDAVRLIRLRAMARHLELLESRAALCSAEDASIRATVIVCTHRSIPPLEDALSSLANQRMPGEEFEIVVVNNNPEDGTLRASLDVIKGNLFGKETVCLREVACPLPGLAQARNAGIAAARGEVVLFLDDDAAAPPGWVSTAVALFDGHPGVGVIGGHIRLVPPEPRPEVLHPGWERYWSQFLSEKESFHTVEEWWHYPWGASWCARRSVLLQIGGFRAGYGRTGGDFAGGEEVVAASLAKKLGWQIAVAPELEVEHRVMPERFTWGHVRKTILAGTLGNYRMQRDLYLPMEGVKWTIRCLFSPAIDRTVGANSMVARARHWVYRRRAWARLLAWQMRDYRRRRKPPRFGSIC